MMDNIKVSIIMPSLNVAPYIRECIDSVVNQSLKSIEMICVDAGSTDGTLKILQEYSKKDIRIRLINSKKKSYGAQVNVGLNMAGGEYIAIVETDDFIKESMYEDLAQLADRTQADYVKADYDTVIMSGDGNYYYERVRKLDAFPYFYNKILTADDLMKICMTESTLWRGIYRRSFLETHHIRLHESDGASFQDLSFVLQTLLRAKRAYYTDRSYYCYRIDRQEASTWSPDCFIKVTREIAWILNSGMISDLSDSQKYAARSVLVNSFMWSLRQTINSGNIDVRNNCFDEAYQYFYDTVKKWLGESGFSDGYFSEFQWNRVCQALEEPEIFIESERKEKEKETEFYKRLTDRKFVIFGCGKSGKNTFFCAIKRGVKPVAFCDNNDSLWGSEWEKVPILSPVECVKKYPDILYVVANNYHEIKIQLLYLGIPESQIAGY